MWWWTSIRPLTIRLTPDVVCPSSSLQGRAALAPATASVLRNDLRDAPESIGVTFTLPKSLELSGLLQKQFRMAAPRFQCLCWICGARYHSAAGPEPKMFAHCKHFDGEYFSEVKLSFPVVHSSPSPVRPQCPLWLFSEPSVLNSERPNTEATENHREPQSGGAERSDNTWIANLHRQLAHAFDSLCGIGIY